MSRIYIGRLSYNAREKDVERFFRGFGRIRDINLKNGFGFVVSYNVEQASPEKEKLMAHTCMGIN